MPSLDVVNPKIGDRSGLNSGLPLLTLGYAAHNFSEIAESANWCGRVCGEGSFGCTASTTFQVCLGALQRVERGIKPRQLRLDLGDDAALLWQWWQRELEGTDL